MAGQQWKKGEVAAIMQNGCHGRPWRGLFLLCGAADEPHMDGQLLRISEPREVGVTPGRYGYFEVRRSKEHLQREGVDSGPHLLFTLPFVPLGILLREFYQTTLKVLQITGPR